MGGPMTYQRFLGRNGMKDGGYESQPHGSIRGDLRRMERDTLEVYADRWAHDLNLSPVDVRRVLDRFFNEP